MSKQVKLRELSKPPRQDGVFALLKVIRARIRDTFGDDVSELLDTDHCAEE